MRGHWFILGGLRADELSPLVHYLRATQPGDVGYYALCGKRALGKFRAETKGKRCSACAKHAKAGR